MTDYPPGQFTILMIGPYWPSGMSVISTVNAARNRGTVQSFFDDYTSQLVTTRTGPLAPMEGVTADSIRDLFKNGESQASAVADKNGVKQKAFSDAADALNGLRPRSPISPLKATPRSTKFCSQRRTLFRS